jgi:hypothetical protein
MSFTGYVIWMKEGKGVVAESITGDRELTESEAS